MRVAGGLVERFGAKHAASGPSRLHPEEGSTTGESLLG